MLDPDDAELCLIALCATEGVGPVTVARLCRAAEGRGVPLEAMVALPAAELEAELGLTGPAARLVAGIRDPLEAGRRVLARLGRLGVRVVQAGAAEYPVRLGRFLGAQAPPVLFVAGDLSLLRRPCLAVVGSRRPSRGAAEAARFLAEDQAAAGTAIVSGGARGIDTLAHGAAMVGGGTVVIPALGIARLHPHGPLGREPADGRWCALGQFPPEASWRSAHALMRNRTIVALSGAVVAFEPRDCGGTWHSSITALRMRKPLYVVTAARQGAKDRGLRRLVRMGAAALDPDRMPDAPALACLVADYRPPPCAGQLPLFDLPEGRRPGADPPHNRP